MLLPPHRTLLFPGGARPQRQAAAATAQHVLRPTHAAESAQGQLARRQAELASEATHVRVVEVATAAATTAVVVVVVMVVVVVRMLVVVGRVHAES